MTVMVKLSVLAAGLGSPILGNNGTYMVAADGTVSVDSRDVSALLAAGATYVAAKTGYYGQTQAVLVATVGKLVASTSLVNGALTIANQPDVMRQGAVITYAGTSAITGGSISVPYIANDGTLTTDVLSLVTAASGNATLFTSKGIAVLSTPTISGLVGGATPGIHLDTTATISVPVDSGVKDVTFVREQIDTGEEAVGTPSTVTLASIAPTTAPNGTHTYGFLYTANTPEV